MSLAATAHHFAGRLNTRRRTDVETQAAEEGSGGDGGGGHHAREASGRSVLSNISDRFASMRQRERESDMFRVQNRIERATTTAAARGDIEAGALPATEAPGGASAIAPAAGDTTVAAAPTSGAKSRREKEEGATLFGPNLANYFGTGSSSSGAVAGLGLGGGGTSTQPGAGPANGTTSPLAPAVPTSPTSPGPNDGTWGLRGRTRLGSRGRARGASLSGLSNLSLPLEADESVASLPQQVAADLPNEQLAMAEGIEISTLRRWIERSTVGGAVEIAGPDGASSVKGDLGNPPTLCSTLQSYVNLKRNTVRLNLASAEQQQSVLQNRRLQAATDASASSPVLESPLALRSVTSFGTFAQSSKATSIPPPTHSLQFEYDCAAPLATIQVFVRASRKHGTWLNWIAMREAQGLATDLTLDGADEDKYLAQRGPPPHVLGWPVHSAKIRRGFGKPLVASLPLHIDYFAPPKPAVSKDTKKDGPAVPETPGLREEAPAAPPLTPVTPGVVDPLIAATIPAEETKEEKAAREKAERETLKMAIVVEALDEEGKTLKEPNLQMTYLRLSSLPVRSTMQETMQHANEEAGPGVRDGDAVQDIAPVATEAHPDGKGDEEEQLKQDEQRQQEVKRVWSIQVEGQEAEIGPHRFQLQELYGLSSRPPPVRSPEDDDGEHENENEEGGATQQTAATPVVDFEGSSGGECLICLSSPPTTLLLPCTHGLCLECAVQLRDSVKATREGERRRGKKPRRKYACPVCRRPYTNMLHLSPADEKAVAQAAAAVI